MLSLVASFEQTAPEAPQYNLLGRQMTILSGLNGCSHVMNKPIYNLLGNISQF